MMTFLLRLRQILGLPFRHPGLLALSAAYATLLSLTSLQASLYDIGNPFWVLTVAAVILVSPIFHAAFLHLSEGILRGRKAPLAGLGTRMVVCLPALILGELLVNGLVVAGSLALFLPGIYIGVRLALYKQAIVFSGVRPSVAIRESLVRTRDWKRSLNVFAAMAIYYAVIIGSATMLSRLPELWIAEIGGIVVLALLLTWLNLFLTVVYVESEGEPRGLDLSANGPR